MDRRRFLTAGTAVIAAASSAGCIGRAIPNPLGGDGSGNDGPNRDRDPFASIESRGYDLIVRFETHQSRTVTRGSTGAENSDQQSPTDGTGTQTRSGSASGGKGGAGSSSDTERGPGPGAADIAQVALTNSVGELVTATAPNGAPDARLRLLSISEGGARINDVFDFGRHTIVAITHDNRKFKRPIELRPKLEIKRVAFPNQLDRGGSTTDPLRYANPIVEFGNTGTAPGVIVETAASGSDVPNPRADPDERREERRETPEEGESKAFVPRGAAMALFTSPSLKPTPAVPIKVGGSVLTQTGFNPLAVPKELYTDDGEIGGGVTSLRRDYTTTDLDFDLYLQTRMGPAFEVPLTVRLDGGVSEVTVAETDYYVFRSPKVVAWNAEASDG